MFIRFMGKGPDHLERTVQCRDYSIRLSLSSREKHVRIIDGEHTEEFILEEGDDSWNRAFLMNDNGETIDTILAPSLEAFKKASENQREGATS